MSATRSLVSRTLTTTSARRIPLCASTAARARLSAFASNRFCPIPSIRHFQVRVRQMSSSSQDSPSSAWLARAESDPYTHIIPSSPAPGVALISLNRPKALNALCAALILELNDVVDRIEKDESIATVIVTGS